MPSGDEHNEQWEACPSGQLTGMVRRLEASQRRAQRKQVFNTALLSTAVFAIVVLAAGTWMGPASTSYGGIRCSVCRANFDAYNTHLSSRQLVLGEGGLKELAPADAVNGELAGSDLGNGKLGNMNAAFITSMQIHLEKCSFCRERFQAKYPDQPLTASARRQPAVVLAFAHGHH